MPASRFCGPHRRPFRTGRATEWKDWVVIKWCNAGIGLTMRKHISANEMCGNTSVKPTCAPHVEIDIARGLEQHVEARARTCGSIHTGPTLHLER